MDEIRPDPQHLLGLKLHWGLHRKNETIVFYSLAIPCWGLEIAAAALGPYFRASHPAFIGCISAFFVLHWAAWTQTAFAMVQRASWRRDEEAVEERVQFLWFAVRLQRLMLVCHHRWRCPSCEEPELTLAQPTAFIALCTFIPAYVQRNSEHDLAYWLLFMLIFIIDTVLCVMNAYNNITWVRFFAVCTARIQYANASSQEADRLWFEDRIPGVPNTHIAIFGV